MRVRVNHRRAAERGSYLCWSILDGTVTIRMPWTDVLVDGRLPAQTYDTLRKFERQVEERIDKGQAWPDLPTPNAVVTQIDNTAFERDLRHRREVYVNAMRFRENGGG